MNQQNHLFRVGAGEAPVILPPEAFPTPAPEHYIGIHDNLSVRVILIEQEERYAIFAADMVNIKRTECYINILADVMGVSEKNIVIHTNHCLGAPHFEPDSNLEIFGAFLEATNQAARLAVETIREAKFGFGMGLTNINVHRIIKRSDGYWQGTNIEGYSDHSLPVLRFDDLKGDIIALLYIVNCPPGVNESSCLEDGGRLVTADISGAASRFLKKRYGDKVVTAYCSGATGDQWQVLRSKRVVYEQNGSYQEKDLNDKGFWLIDLVGEQLAQQVAETAEKIVCGETKKIRLYRRMKSYPSQKRIQFVGKDCFVPHKNVTREENGVLSSEITVLQINDMALVCIAPEIQCCTVRDIREASDFKYMALMGWSNFTNESNGTYMMERDVYENGAYQSFKSCWQPGSAELLRDDVIAILQEIKELE